MADFRKKLFPDCCPEFCVANVFCELKERELCPWKGGDKISKRVQIRQEEPHGEWVIITRLERELSDVTKTGGTSLEFQKLRQEDCRLKVVLQSEFIQGQLGQLIPWQKNEKEKRKEYERRDKPDDG